MFVNLDFVCNFMLLTNSQVPKEAVGAQRLNDAGAALSTYHEEVAKGDRYSAPPKSTVRYISRLQVWNSIITCVWSQTVGPQWKCFNIIIVICF